MPRVAELPEPAFNVFRLFLALTLVHVLYSLIHGCQQQRCAATGVNRTIDADQVVLKYYSH